MYGILKRRLEATKTRAAGFLLGFQRFRRLFQCRARVAQRTCEDLLDEAEAGEIFIITSSFTLVEVIKLKGKTPILVTEQDEITEFFKKDYFRFVDATRKVTEAARSLIWKSPGLMAQGCGSSCLRQSSSLVREKLDCIHSYDKDFLRLER